MTHNVLGYQQSGNCSGPQRGCLRAPASATSMLHYFPYIEEGFTFQSFTHLFASDISSSSTEALCECSHHDVDIFGIQAKVVHHSSAVRPQGPDTVGLIQVQIRLVALLQSDDLWQTHDGPLHTSGEERDVKINKFRVVQRLIYSKRHAQT